MLKFKFSENEGGSGDDKGNENSVDAEDGEHNHSLSK